MSARPEVTGRKIGVANTDGKTGAGDKDDRDAFSIAEFCRRNSISIALFYKIQAQGEGPETFYVGERQLVSREAAAKWRKAREKEAPAERKARAKAATERAARWARRRRTKVAAKRAERAAAEA